LTQGLEASSTNTRPGLIALVAVYFFYIAVVIRTLALEVIRPRLPIYLALELIYLFLFTWMLWRPGRHLLWQHIYFSFQSLLVLALLSLRFNFDFIVVLFVLLSFQSALIFQGQARWTWVAILTSLTCIPLMAALGVLPGLAVALLPMTVGIVFPAYVTVTQEIDAGLQRNQVLLTDLQTVNQKLTAYAGQVDELAAIQERNRLARELHDSVSQTIFSISLHTRAAQLLLARSPAQLRPQLEQLQTLTQSALIEMRGLITHLRPPNN
jgi:signal transduction histidine kinase